MGARSSEVARRHIDVLGVHISETNPGDTLDAVASWIENGSREYVCVTPVSSVMAAQRDSGTMQALNGASLVVPDGMPIVWAGRYAGSSSIARVYGPDMMAAVCAEAANRGWTSFLYGGADGVAEQLRDRLQRRFPGLRIVGTHTPPFRDLDEEERVDIAEMIDRSGADLVWVGLSSPKQDLWMADMVPRLRQAAVMLGVGAAFDVHAGLKKQPPAWMGPVGLFWLYRLLQEPRRLWRRYVFDIPRFLYALARQRPKLRGVEARPHQRAAPAVGPVADDRQ